MPQKSKCSAHLLIAIGLFFAAATVRVSHAQQAPDLAKRVASLEKKMQEQQDIHELSNLMSLRAFLHGAGLQGKELDLWSNRDDVSWGQQNGFRVGIKNVRAAYDERFRRVKAQELAAMHKLYPDVADDPSNLFVGSLDFHTLTTPILQVAGDGQTAKGMWYTPGFVSGPSAKGGGALNPSWMWERYAVDFIKEDGKWKFWHVVVLTDFGLRVGSTFSQGNTGPNLGTEGTFMHEPPIPMDVKRDLYKEYSATTVPHLYPPPPVPYRTFSETFSYGPNMPPPK